MKTLFRQDIQVLRAIAVIAVIAFHTKENLFLNGYLGVDAFFVISGFVVTPLLIRITTSKESSSQTPRLVDFYVRRIFRLVPASGFVLLVSTLLLIAFSEPDDIPRFVKQGIASVLFLGNLGAIKFSGNYFSPDPNPFVHTWSLAVEEQIYFVLPIIMIFVFRKYCNQRRLFSFFGLMVFISLTSRMLLNFVIPQWVHSDLFNADNILFYSPITRIWEFCIGSLAYLLSIARSSRVKNPLIQNVLLTCLVIYLLSPFQLVRGMNAEVFTCFLTTLCLLSVPNVPRNSFIHNLLSWFGDRSYSLYLIHMPIIHIAKYSPLFENLLNSKIRVLSSFLVIIGLGDQLYRHIEQRYRLTTNRSRNNGEFKTVILLFFALPLTVLILANAGATRQFWGLDRNPIQPEFPGFIDPECDQNSEVGPPCEYLIEDADRSLVLIGDSHAGHISQAWIDAAHSQKSNAIIWKNLACVNSTEDSSAGYCTMSKQKLYDYSKRNKIDVAVVSFFIRNSSDIASRNSFIEELSRYVAEVIVIGQTPVFPDENKFFVSKPIFFEPYNAPKSFPISKMNNEDNNASFAFEEWARNKGFRVIDPRSTFCSNSQCVRFQHNRWLYSDDDHLSVDGAKKLIPLFREVLSGVK